MFLVLLNPQIRIETMIQSTLRHPFIDSRDTKLKEDTELKE